MGEMEGCIFDYIQPTAQQVLPPMASTSEAMPLDEAKSAACRRGQVRPVRASRRQRDELQRLFVALQHQ